MVSDLHFVSIIACAKEGDNGTGKLLSTLDRVSCTNYFISIEIIRCSVRRIETTKPDNK